MTLLLYHSGIAIADDLSARRRLHRERIRDCCQPGTALVLKPELRGQTPGVAVYLQSGMLPFFAREVRIGYLDPEVAAQVGARLARGERVLAKVSERSEEDPGLSDLGVRVLVTVG